MKSRIIILLFFSFIFSCSQKPKIIITKEYIINKHWNEYNNAIHVEKMKTKNGHVLSVFSKSFDSIIRSNWDLNNVLQADTTFYFGYSGLNTKKDKIKLKDTVYFNRENGYHWYVNNEKRSKIGVLENKNWYKFSRLRSTAYYVYIYVDSIGEIHRFNVNMSNY